MIHYPQRSAPIIVQFMLEYFNVHFLINHWSSLETRDMNI